MQEMRSFLDFGCYKSHHRVAPERKAIWLLALATKSLLLIFCATVLARESKVEDDVRMPASK
jgi:hypothetical protein